MCWNMMPTAGGGDNQSNNSKLTLPAIVQAFQAMAGQSAGDGGAGQAGSPESESRDRRLEKSYTVQDTPPAPGPEPQRRPRTRMDREPRPGRRGMSMRGMASRAMRGLTRYGF